MLSTTVLFTKISNMFDPFGLASSGTASEGAVEVVYKKKDPQMLTLQHYGLTTQLSLWIVLRAEVGWQLLSGLQQALLKHQVTEMTLGEMILQMSVKKCLFFSRWFYPALAHILGGVCAVVGALGEGTLPHQLSWWRPCGLGFCYHFPLLWWIMGLSQAPYIQAGSEYRNLFS